MKRTLEEWIRLEAEKHDIPCDYRGEIITHGAAIATNQWSGVIYVIGGAR